MQAQVLEVVARVHCHGQAAVVGADDRVEPDGKLRTTDSTR
jgi:hypothetical protein